jgi:hypothetical protein
MVALRLIARLLDFRLIARLALRLTARLLDFRLISKHNGLRGPDVVKCNFTICAGRILVVW